MNFSIAEFTQVAKNNWFNNDIVLTENRNALTSQFFHSKSSVDASAQMNNKVMEAFHKALTREFGDFGEEAWTTLLKDRYDHDRSLRKNDVLKAVKMAERGHSRNVSGVRAVVESRIYAILQDRNARAAGTGIPWEARKVIFPKLVKRIEHDLKRDHHLMVRLTEAIKVGAEKNFYDPLQNYIEDLLNEVKARVEAGLPTEELVEIPDENDVLNRAEDAEDFDDVSVGRHSLRDEYDVISMDDVRAAEAEEDAESVEEGEEIPAEDLSESFESGVEDDEGERAWTTIQRHEDIHAYDRESTSSNHTV